MVAKPTQKAVRIDAKIHRAAKRAADQQGRKLYAFVENAIRLAVQDHQTNLKAGGK